MVMIAWCCKPFFFLKPNVRLYLTSKLSLQQGLSYRILKLPVFLNSSGRPNFSEWPKWRKMVIFFLSQMTIARSKRQEDGSLAKSLLYRY